MARSAGLTSIYYNDEDGGRTNITFHAIISEGHSVSNEVTKFPIQSGYEISNNSIKKNRVVELEAIVSNVALAGQVSYGTRNASEGMYKLLKTLVSSSVVCTVKTNLGKYSPVIFTKFTTKQGAGSLDSMTFKMIGEEVQVQEKLNKTAPKDLSFEIIPEEEYQGYIDLLACQGTEVYDGAELSRARLTEGESFSVDTVGTDGEPYKVTYESVGTSSTTGLTNYIAHTTDTDYYTTPLTASFSMFDLPETGFESILEGTSPASICLIEGGSDIAVEQAGDLIDTQIGILQKSLYGAKQEIVNLGGSDAGQQLIGLGLDCVTAGIAYALSDEAPPNACNIGPPTDLPTVDDVINGLGDVTIKSQEFIKVTYNQLLTTGT